MSSTGDIKVIEIFDKQQQGVYVGPRGGKYKMQNGGKVYLHKPSLKCASHKGQ